MELYFAVRDGQMVATKHALKLHQGIGTVGSIKKFDLPVEQKYDKNRALLKIFIKSFSMESVIDKNLYMSYFMLHIEDFKNQEFTQWVTKLWLNSVVSIANCLNAFSRQELEKEKHTRHQERKILKKLRTKRLYSGAKNG